MVDVSYVYILWDDTDDWGSNGKVKLHSVHANKSSAEKEKSKQWRNGEFFRIEKTRLRVNDDE